MSTPVEQALLETGALLGSAQDQAEQARIIAEYIEAFQPGDPTMEPEALFRRWKPGEGAEITCIKPRNFLINWRKALFEGVPRLVAGVAAYITAPVVGCVALVGALYNLVGHGTIKLGKDHAEVVEALWMDANNRDLNPVPLDDLRQALQGKAARDKLDTILNDLDDMKIIGRPDDETVEKRDWLILR
jgi:hypothetical protein